MLTKTKKKEIENNKTIKKLLVFFDLAKILLFNIAIYFFYSVENKFEKSLFSSKAFPVPLTTHKSGSSAVVTGKLVDLLRTVSKLPSKDPPPVKTIPLSTISAASSAGVCSKAFLIVSIIWATGSVSASAICLWFIDISFG